MPVSASDNLHVMISSPSSLCVPMLSNSTASLHCFQSTGSVDRFISSIEAAFQFLLDSRVLLLMLSGSILHYVLNPPVHWGSGRASIMSGSVQEARMAASEVRKGVKGSARNSMKAAGFCGWGGQRPVCISPALWFSFFSSTYSTWSLGSPLSIIIPFSLYPRNSLVTCYSLDFLTPGFSS